MPSLREVAYRDDGEMTRQITIKRECDGSLVAEDVNAPGSPPVGRSRNSMVIALGEWLINNQESLDIFINVDPSAQADEDARRKRELARR